LNNPRLKKSGIPIQPLPRRAANTVAPATEKEDDGSVASFGSEVKSLLEGFLETIIKSVGANAGVIRMLSPNGRELQIAGAVGLSPEIIECEGHVDLACGVCGRAVNEGNVYASDAFACMQLSNLEYFGKGCKQVIAVPLEFRGNPIGVFNLFFNSKQEISGDASRILRSFAELIGISLENARLARENRRMNLMAERQAIANEIHDSLAQTLVYSRMRMSVLQEAMRKQDELTAHKCLRDVNEALDSGQKSIRELITHFRCQMDPLGLQHALQMLVNEFGERSGIALEYSNRVADPGLPLEHELQVYNIVRELLANVAAHSGATEARLLVSRKDGRYMVTVEDNGAGMSSVAEPEGHYGLTIMRERAQRIGAEITVDSTEGCGTRVCLSLSAA
jgi:two-component system, NarL family, nitrate/nitrite sensor histidine kinase NarX